MALILKASGSEVEVVDLDTLTLENMQRVVGGYIEKVKCERGVLFVNEEARLTGLPFNSDASALAGQTILGDAIFLKPEEEKELK